MSGATRRVIFKAAKPDISEAYTRLVKLYPEIEDSIKTFNTNKRTIPPTALPGKMDDHHLNPPFEEYRECHLASDVLLIYTHENDIVSMLALCTHDEIKGKRGLTLKKKLKNIRAHLN